MMLALWLFHWICFCFTDDNGCDLKTLLIISRVLDKNHEWNVCIRMWVLDPLASVMYHRLYRTCTWRLSMARWAQDPQDSSRSPGQTPHPHTATLSRTAQTQTQTQPSWILRPLYPSGWAYIFPSVSNPAFRVLNYSWAILSWGGLRLRPERSGDEEFGLTAHIDPDWLSTA